MTGKKKIELNLKWIQEKIDKKLDKDDKDIETRIFIFQAYSDDGEIEIKLNLKASNSNSQKLLERLNLQKKKQIIPITIKPNPQALLDLEDGEEEE